jgi:hypothetical protein
MDEPILQFFAFEHLPVPLQDVSRPFCELAQRVIGTLPRNPERTVAWAALCRNCYPAYAFAKRALQDHDGRNRRRARLDRDWLSRGMSDPASLGAYALHYGELKGGRSPGAARLKNPRHGLRVMNVGAAAMEKSPLLLQLQT